MNNRNSILRVIATIGLLLTLGARMNADAGVFGLGGDSWKEEVLLHDGQKIIVQRSQSYGGRGEPGKSSPVKEHRISFTPPGSKKSISWTSEYGEELGRANFNLLAVHVLGGTPYLVVEPNLCLAYNKWGRPNPPYVFFKYEGGEWQRSALEAFPAEFKTLNVIVNKSRQLDIQKLQSGVGYVPAAGVQKLNGSLEQPEYRSILRVIVTKGTVGSLVNCEEMVSTGKDGWLSIDWFNRQPNLDACLKVCTQKNISSEYCPCNNLFKGK